MTLFIFWFD